MALFLKDEDVAQAVSMDDMLAAIEGMQRRYGMGEASSLGRRKIHTADGMLSVLGGELQEEGVFGVKTYTTFPGKYRFHITLYSSKTGQLLAFLQANRLGQVRTGATTGVTAKYLAQQDASVLGILGTGFQAFTQLQAVCKVRPIKSIKAYSRGRENLERFAHEASEGLGVEVAPAADSKEVVEDSDVVVCITNSPEPVLDGTLLKPAALLVSAGPTSWRSREVDDASLRRATTIVVDSLEQAPHEAGDLVSAADRGLIRWSQIMELRQVVAGTGTFPTNDGGVIYAKLLGTRVADAAAANLAYTKALEKGLGTETDF